VFAGPGAVAEPPLTKYQQQQQERFKDSAPADRYFGRLKMSFLGINNTLRFEALRAGDHTTDSSVLNKVNYAADSLDAWAAEYPRDPQLARSYFLAVHVYKKIWTKPAQEKAWAYMQIILAHYPQSYFAKQVRADLAAGFTEHYYAAPLPCPTPMPTPSPTPEVTASPVPSPSAPARNRRLSAKPPAPSATPVPSATPSPVPSPTPSPAPSPSATPAGERGPRHPNVEILIPPCSPLPR
jgi:hypothetical protein